MTFDCQITNAVAVTPSGRYPATIAITGGRVAGLLTEPSAHAARTIDADGLLALPGMVDQHVHFMDPGDSAREDFIHGSSAAAAGGVTTVIEHTHSNPVLSRQDLREKAGHLAGRSIVDFGLAAHVFPDTIDEVPALWEAGASLPVLAATGTPGNPISDAELHEKFQDLVDPVLGRVAAERLAAAVDDLEQADSLEALVHEAVRSRR